MIGQTLTALMEHHGLNLQEVARIVREAGAQNVRYQHIQHLIGRGSTVPRYLRELAAAFGMTVEQMSAWRPGDPIPPLPSKSHGASHKVNEERPPPYNPTPPGHEEFLEVQILFARAPKHLRDRVLTMLRSSAATPQTLPPPEP